MPWTLCTSGAAIWKGGTNANSTITASGSTLNQWSDDAEASICAETKYDWVTNYTSVGASYQNALDHATSALIAMNIINYDMSGYTSRSEAQTMLDVLRDQYRTAIKFLKEDALRRNMGAT